MAKASTIRSMSPENVRKDMATMLLGSVLTMNIFTLLMTDTYKAAVAGWMLTVCSASVVVISAIILYRQRFKGLYGRTYGAMTIGLILWFAAETVLGGGSNTSQSIGSLYAQISVAQQQLTPSLTQISAEVIWLAGYGFFAYFLFKLMSHFSRSIKPNVLTVVAVATAFASLVLAQSIAYYFNDQLQGNANGEAGISLFFKILHPILDMLLIIPALVTMLALKDGKLTSTPWLLLASAVLILAIEDIGDIYFSILYEINNHWVWTMFGTAAYLCIATSLFWYNKFFIFDAKVATRIWQESNR
jgi:hypothetical protein